VPVAKRVLSLTIQPEISLIIPFLNESETLPALIAEISKFLTSPDLPAIEVIFVDDGSTDASFEILQSATLTFPARLVRLSKNFGTHVALRAGISIAAGRLITNNYADLQDPLDLIPQLHNLCQSGADIAWACRGSTKYKLSQRTFSLLYAWLVRLIIAPKFPEMGLDIFMINRKIKDELDQNPERNSSIVLQIMKLGFTQKSLYYTKQDRKIGTSKWTLAKKFKLVVDTFVPFSLAPLRLISAIGVGFIVASVILFASWVSGVLPSHSGFEGWMGIICVLCLGFGATNISLGIMAEYLWRGLDSGRKQKPYTVDSILELQSKA